MKLTGKVTRYNESVYGAKVYITDAKNSYVDKDRVGRTDPDGKFSISAPIINENGVDVIDTSKYIAFESYSPQGKGIKQYKIHDFLGILLFLFGFRIWFFRVRPIHF